MTAGKKEKPILLQQINELETEYQLKIDEAEDYSRRNCLIITRVKKEEGKDTDRVVLDLFEKKLNINLDILQVDRHKRPGSDNLHPYIVKLATYRSRNLVFKSKK